MHLHRFATFFLAAIWLAGCATAQLSPEAKMGLKRGGVAAAFYVEGKKIQYDEMVYRVLWNENRSQDSVFEGSWDVDKDVSGTFAAGLKQAGLSAKPIDAVLADRKLYDAFEQVVLNTRLADGKNTPIVMDEALRRAFVEADVDYVVLIRAAFYRAQKVSGFKPQFALPAMLIVYDVARNEQSYSRQIPLGGPISVEESPREVEANGLAKLKTATHDWVRKAATENVPDMLKLDS
ncbi:MAG: hypothetical protein AB7P23_01645 [Amphiplicatus sp.]